MHNRGMASDPTDKQATQTTHEPARPRTMAEWDAKYSADLDVASKALFEAITAYTDALQKKHNFLGWQTGWDSGWDAAMEHVKKRASDNMQAAFADSVPTALELATATTSPPMLTPTANGLVHQFIHENPGKRGVEIADNFSKTVWRLPERTVRTALHRLKKAGKIVVVDGRWYEPDIAPKPSQRLLEPSLEEV